jgi:hypothetical protein
LLVLSMALPAETGDRQSACLLPHQDHRQMNIYLKVACYAALMAVWGTFAFFGKTSVEGFVAAITAALAALAAIHASSSGASDQAAASVAPAAPAAPAAPQPAAPAPTVIVQS